MKVLLITTEWPEVDHPNTAPFLVQHVKLLNDLGVNAQVYPFRGKKNVLNYMNAWFNIRKTSEWKNAEILHAHWGQSAFLALFSRKKLVITFHGSDLQGIVNSSGKYTIPGRILTGFSRWIAAKADYCIVVSSRLKQYLPKKIKNIKTIPIGIDLKAFYPMDKDQCRESLNLKHDSRIILFVSDPKRTEKRFPLAQQAVKRLREIHPEYDLQLLVVNGVEYKKIPYYINAGDVLILTSTHEGSPTVVKEALACKVPVVSFNVGDVEERIKEIPGCYLCEDQTVDCLVKGLEIALSHGPLLGISDVALKQIDERKNVLEIINIYAELMKDG